MTIKKRLLIPIFVAVGSAVILAGCGGRDAEPETAPPAAEAPPAETAENRWEKDGLTVYPVADSPGFPGASLSLDGFADGQDLSSSDEVQFSFEVANFTLGEQTADAETKGLANSADGQHLHMVFNNDPYSAHYEAEFGTGFEPGHYVMLAFLSRSYHESLKNPEAAVVRQFTVDGAEARDVDLTAPHLFYSRPKDTYSGRDAERLMLDFYLLNTTLSADGNRVRATINGTEFVFTEWRPYVIEGLPVGEVEIQLELIDAAGEVVPGPFNSVTRTVTLEYGEEEDSA